MSQPNPYSQPAIPPERSDENPESSLTTGVYLTQLLTCLLSILGPTIIASAIAYPACYGLRLIGLDRIAVGTFAVVLYSVTIFRLVGRDSTGSRRGIKLFRLLRNPPFTPTHYFLIASAFISLTAMIAASAYILHDHCTRRKSPDMMPELDIPVLVFMWLLYISLCIAPAWYFARRGTAPSQHRVSAFILWVPTVIIAMSFGSLLI